ncbi:MAG: polysaccharide biosynthesis tyrosine autokinase [Gemmatimonadota bacterium]|nr:polysaccharide biosynthesis tyrosine autokinase [Gemmatimonadota bacterium]MDH3423525.1 polysaccharide biosynthesis tyrosine autokinase [Gemmatimonadota bacterium]
MSSMFRPSDRAELGVTAGPGDRGGPAPSGERRRAAGGPPGADPAFTDLFQVLRSLKRHAVLVISATGIGIAVAVVWIMVEVPQYRATAVVRVGEAREELTRGIELQSSDDERFINPFLSTIQLLTSRSILGDVVDSAGLRLKLDYRGFDADLLRSVQIVPDPRIDELELEFGIDGFTVRTTEPEVRAEFGRPVEVGGVTFVVEAQPTVGRATWTVVPREKAIDQLLGDLRVTPRDQTNVVDVSFLHPSPLTAQRVVNTLVAAYQDLEAHLAQQSASRRRIFLEEQVAETELRLDEAQQALSTFQTRAGSYNAGDELAARQANRLSLQIRASELEADRGMLQTLLDQLDAAPTEDERSEALRTLVSSPGIAENAVVSQMHERLMRNRTALDSLTLGGVGAAGNSPEVRRQRELIASAERELTSAIRSHFASLEARAAALEDVERRTDAALATIPSQLAQGARLSQVVTTYQSLSDQLREEYQRARMAEAVSVGESDIIDLASLPYEPAPRLLVVKVGLGFFLGLTFGGFGAVGIEYGRRTVRNKHELEQMIRLPVLAVIPEAGELRDGGRSSERALGSGEGDGSQDASPVRLKEAYAGEAFRMLCTHLLFADWADEMRTISITSTVPQEGKTLVATNLAVAMANEGMKVLLVDADIWRGRVHEVLGMPVSPGVADVLRGDASAKDCVRKTGVKGLSILPRGESGASPSLLRRNGALRTVFEGLDADFEVVLVDGPPVLAAGSAPALGAVTDGVVLVVRAGRTDRESVEEALRELASVRAHVVGAILNDPEGFSKTDHARYRYYEYASQPSPR